MATSTIAERLHAVREDSGLALRSFAERLTEQGFSVSAATVGSYENGRTGKVPVDYVAAVCRTFGCSPAWLLLGTGPVEDTPVEEASIRLAAVRSALEGPLPSSDSPSLSPSLVSEPSELSEPAEEAGAGFLIDLVPVLSGLLGGDADDRRLDAVRLVDYLSTRLSDAGLLAATDRRTWRTFVGGAAPGPGAGPVSVLLAEVVGDEAAQSPSLYQLLHEVGEVLHDVSAFAVAASCAGAAYRAAQGANDVPGTALAASRRARFLKLTGDWPGAVEWYQRSMQLAEGIGDWDTYALSLDGMAWLRFDQGANKDAERIAKQLLEMGEQRELPTVVGHGHHLLSALAFDTREWEDGVWHAWQAVLSHSSEERYRALFMAGSHLLEAGLIDAAEHAYQLSWPGLDDLSTQALCRSALTHVAAFRGDVAEFDRRRAELEQTDWDRVSLRNRSQIMYFSAKSLAMFGRSDEARRGYKEALRFAEQHGFNRQLIQAEEALAVLDSGEGARPSAPDPVEGRVEEVVTGLQKMAGRLPQE